jgi:hypothetical protein
MTMADHFGCVGVPVESAEYLVGIAERAATTAVAISARGGTYYHWADPSGAELWIQADGEGQFLGINPHFSGESVIEFVLTDSIHREAEGALEGAFHGWVAPDESGESGLYPMVFDSPCALTHADLAFPHRARVQVAAMPQEVRLFETEEAYDSGDVDTPGFASQFFVPSGLFGADPQAVGVMTGLITKVERLTNGLTEASFWWLLVESLGGSFDVVAAPSDFVESPAVGGVIYGTFWLSGRLLPPA